jgi:hypothetical protein
MFADYASDMPVKLLAVLGAAAAGGFFVTAGMQFFVKATFGQKVPPWPTWAVRILSAVLFGWMVTRWLFRGEGGTGFFGSGTGTGTSSENDKAYPGSKKADKKDAKDKADEPPVTASETITVEVLGDEPLRKLAKSETFDGGKRYRVAGQPGLRSLEEVRKLVLGRRDAKPPLKRLELVLYLDSPDRQGAQVASLVEWANDLEEKGKKWLRVDLSEKDRYAPLE